MAKQIIDSVKLYKFNVIMPNSSRGRQHVFVRIGSGGAYGWGECGIPVAKNGAESFNTASALEGLYGKSVSEAFAYVRSMFGSWRYGVSEMAEFALIDLQGVLTGRSALDLLVLNGYSPVMCANTVAARDREQICARIGQLLSVGQGRIVKIRLAGEPEYDRDTVAAIRQRFGGEKLYLVGSAAGAYSNAFDFSVEKLGVQLLKIYTAGLDACEDPADMNVSDWVRLQEFVDPMPLIAEAPLRPARRALSHIRTEMSHMYCIRPGVAGSVFDVAALAEKLKSAGHQFVIGDDGFIGPGCAQWQQLAIGMGAEWVEAIEKPVRSDPYFESLRASAVIYNDGMYGIIGGRPGFGLDIDGRMLELYATQVIDL